MKKHLERIKEAGEQFNRSIASTLWELEQIVNHIPMILCVKDFDGNLIRINKFLGDKLGIDYKTFKPTTAHAVFSVNDAERFKESDRDVKERNRPVLNIHEKFIAANGNIIYVIVDKYPYINAEGDVIGSLVCANDVTKRVLFKKHLLEHNCTLCENCIKECKAFLERFGVYVN